MITKETYRDLVLTGSKILKIIIERDKLYEKYNVDGSKIPDDVYDYLLDAPLNEVFISLMWIAGKMDFGIKHPFDALRIMYANTASLFAFDHPDAERYLELQYELHTTNTVPKELLEIEKRVSPDIIYWVGRNL